jgi:hypothetical protein
VKIQPQWVVTPGKQTTTNTKVKYTLTVDRSNFHRTHNRSAALRDDLHTELNRNWRINVGGKGINLFTPVIKLLLSLGLFS